MEKEKIMNSFPTWELHFLVQFDEKKISLFRTKKGVKKLQGGQQCVICQIIVNLVDNSSSFQDSCI